MKRLRISAIVLGSTAWLGGERLQRPPRHRGFVPPDGGTLADASSGAIGDAGDAGPSGEPPGDGGGGDAQNPNTAICTVCSPNASCSLDGGVTCTCNFGWTGDGGTCVNDGPTCAGASGSCVRFAPSGGITVDDLDGTGLLPFVVPLDVIAPPPGAGADAGDAGGRSRRATAGGPRRARRSSTSTPARSFMPGWCSARPAPGTPPRGTCRPASVIDRPSATWR